MVNNSVSAVSGYQIALFSVSARTVAQKSVFRYLAVLDFGRYVFEFSFPENWGEDVAT